MELCKNCGGRIVQVLVEKLLTTTNDDEILKWMHYDNNLSIQCPHSPMAEPVDISAHDDCDLFTDRQKKKLKRLIEQL